MLNKTKKTSFQWRHPCICILIHVDHGQRPITARVVFTSLYKRMSTIKLNTDYVCLGHLANNTRSLLNNWNTFHVALGLFSNRSEKTSKCGLKKINKKWHTSRRQVCHWCFYHILTSSVIYYWTDPRQHGIYLFYKMIRKEKRPIHIPASYRMTVRRFVLV